MDIKRFDYIILQQGTIPLKPDGTHSCEEHRCTSVMIWPLEKPLPNNIILTDPCFTKQGYHEALKQFNLLNLSFDDITRIFITHPHFDHCPLFPTKANKTNPQLQQKHDYYIINKHDKIPGMTIVGCPGHSPTLNCLSFKSRSNDKIWITGDAILDYEWLTKWQYYWPNIYRASEVIQTWKSVAYILSQADIIIPGHGSPITVNEQLLEDLIENFNHAKYASDCLNVPGILHKRLLQLRKKNKAQIET